MSSGVVPGRLLVGLRLARPARRRGFCPACWGSLPEHTRASPGVELATDGVTVAAVLGVAALAWALTAWKMLGSGMAMGSVASFAAIWTLMMAAMMLPSATPLVYRFARQAEGRRRRPAAVAMLVLVYLTVWVAFGIACYLAYRALGLPWRDQGLTGGVALGVAALYALTPLKRLSQDRCREVCALHGPLPFGLIRAGAVAGWRYGLSCVGCTAGLMVAMVLIGMMSLGWAILLAVLVLVYKFAPSATWRWDLVLAALVAALAVVYVVVA